MNRQFHVRDIMAMPKNEIWGLPDGGLMITTDDKEVLKVPTRRVILNSYFWKFFNEWPGAKITKEHFYDERYYRESSHKELASVVFWDVFFGHHRNFLLGEGQKTLWDMSRYLFQVTNEMFNDCISMLGEFAGSLDIEDIVEILRSPDIVKAKEDYYEGKVGVDETHDKIFGSIVDETQPDFHLNPVRLGMMTGALNRRQATQVTGPRAFVPDINGVSPETPIHVGYGDGQHTNYDRIRESKTASISLYMASGPLEDSEYNNRMCQLLCSVITGVHYGHCSGEHAIPWLVEEEDLRQLKGKVYINDAGEDIVIWGCEKELVGKTIRIRSITTCMHSDTTTPCSYCIGVNAITTPPGTNLGLHLTIDPLSKISQTILSFKHVLASTKTFQLNINAKNARFLRLREEHKYLAYLSSEVNTGDCRLRIKRDEAMFLNDVHNVDDVGQLTPTRISCLRDVQIVEYNKAGMMVNTHDISLTVSGKGTAFTVEFLEYLKEREWDIINKDKVEFALRDWDFNKPFIVTPRVGEDITALLKQVKAFIHSQKGSTTPRAIDNETPAAAIRSLLNIMRAKIPVNFTHVEVFVRSLMAAGETSYALPKGGEPFRFIRLKEAVQMRGLGGSLAFEGQPARINAPSSYTRHEDSIPGIPLDHQVM